LVEISSVVLKKKLSKGNVYRRRTDAGGYL